VATSGACKTISVPMLWSEGEDESAGV